MGIKQEVSRVGYQGTHSPPIKKKKVFNRDSISNPPNNTQPFKVWHEWRVYNKSLSLQGRTHSCEKDEEEEEAFYMTQVETSNKSFKNEMG